MYKGNMAHLFQNRHIPAKMKEYCSNEVRKTNQARFRYLSPLVMSAVLVILVVLSCDALVSGMNKRLLAYIITDAAYLVFFTCCYAAWKTRCFFYGKGFNALLHLVFSVSLIWSAVLSALYENITYLIMALLLFAITFAIKPRVFFWTQMSVLVPFVLVFSFIHKTDISSLIPNYLYILFFGLLSFYISRVIYNFTLESIINKRSVELKNEDLNIFIAKLKDLSEVDALTTLLNRRKFDEILLREWKRAVWNASGLVLIFIDIDFFKNYNDTYGHMKGDECLSRIGETLKAKFIRANEYVARYGGEEFAIIMTNSGRSDGIAACRRLLDAVIALHIPHCSSSAADVVTVSAGMAFIIPHDGDKLGDFMNQVDAALYEAKASGRNRYISTEQGIMANI